MRRRLIATFVAAALVFEGAVASAAIASTATPAGGPQTFSSEDGQSADGGADVLSTRWTGSWHCNDRGNVESLAGARVELWQRGLDVLPKFLTDTLIGVSHLDENGSYEFNTVSDGEDDFYVRVLTDDNSTVRLRNWWEPWPWFTDTNTNQNDVAVQDFGSLAIRLRARAAEGSPECAVWQGVRKAYREFETEMGFAPPGGRRVVQTNVPAFTPLAPYTAMLWPHSYPAGGRVLEGEVEMPTKSTTVHEFAHTFRHAYDGDGLHFAEDALGFLYPQMHRDCKATNLGFAFNEGWAEYWAGEFPRENGNLQACEKDQSLLHYEGNVALSLLGLEQCSEYTRQDLVDTLAKSPGQIHSFDEFKARLEALHGPCSELKAPFADARFSVEGDYGPAAFFDSVREEIESLDAAAKRLKRLRAQAIDDVRKISPCWSKGSCLRLLVNQILPSVLGGELAVARVVRRKLAFQLDREALRRLGKLMTPRFQRRLKRKAKDIRRATARVEAEWLDRALKAARPILKRDDDPGVQALGRRLRSSLKAFERGAIPAGYTWAAATMPRLTSTMPLPDLVIERVYIVEEGGWRIWADVRNVGDTDAGASTTVIIQDGQAPVEVATPPLAPGAMTSVSIQCVYAGLGSATARADSSGSVHERNETNNEASGSGGTSGHCRYP